MHHRPVARTGTRGPRPAPGHQPRPGVLRSGPLRGSSRRERPGGSRRRADPCDRQFLLLPPGHQVPGGRGRRPGATAATRQDPAPEPADEPVPAGLRQRTVAQRRRRGRHLRRPVLERPLFGQAAGHHGARRAGRGGHRPLLGSRQWLRRAGIASAPEQADSRSAGRERRARRREAENNGPEPRPLSPVGGAGVAGMSQRSLGRRRGRPTDHRVLLPARSAGQRQPVVPGLTRSAPAITRQARHGDAGDADDAGRSARLRRSGPARGAVSGPAAARPRPARLGLAGPVGRVGPTGPTRAAERADGAPTATGPRRPPLTVQARAATRPPPAAVPGMHPRREAAARPRRTAGAGRDRHFRRAAPPRPNPPPAVAPIRARPAAALTTGCRRRRIRPEAPEARIGARPAAGRPPVRPRWILHWERKPGLSGRQRRRRPLPGAHRELRATRAGITPGRTAAPAIRVAPATPPTPAERRPRLSGWHWQLRLPRGEQRPRLSG